ncbi:MAG: MBL fold metallo-hydrolase [Candidatus Dormibacteraceae bacterium]
MDLTWYGHACFRLRGKRAAVVTDPYPSTLGPRSPRLEADLVTVSHPAANHSFTQELPSRAFRIAGPGEYEVQEVTVLGLDSRQSAPAGAEAPHNTIYVIELDEVRVCHLGDLGQVPDDRLEERIGDVDVLLLPVGGGNAFGAARAAEVVRQLEPRYVVPMHYALPQLKVDLDPLEPFLREMGVDAVEPQTRLSVQSSASPDGELRIVVMEPRAG